MNLANWVCLGLGIILGCLLMLVYRVIASRRPNGTGPTLQTNPVETSEADLLPSAIMAAINRSPVMQQPRTAKRYQGKRVLWQVTFESAIDNGPFTVRLMCQDRGDYPWIFCDVHRSKYPQLQGMMPHALFWVSGRIARITADEIYLRDAGLSFDN